MGGDCCNNKKKHLGEIKFSIFGTIHILGEDAGYFMHVNTASGEEGDSAWLETHRMSLNREHHVQCLQFYYYHSGKMSDHLNIWIREFQDKLDLKGTLRLMGQITGNLVYMDLVSSFVHVIRT